MRQWLEIAPEVRAALDVRRPVVALESTIVTHGMPWPQNVATARQVEAQVRASDAVPACIAVIAGKVHVGLSDTQLNWLGEARDVLKLSRADLPYALAAGRHGSTTVAATMICARLAGIDVFATGGIGGVHRGAELSFDVSADLEELARTDVTVVCAGAKALLDLPKTLEVLETRGVPVVCLGVDRFPAFWSRESDLQAPIRLDSAAEVAALVRVRREMALGGGVLIANPIPHEHEIAWGEMAGFVDQAVAEAEARKVTGKAVTPFLLARILELTDGRSLTSNIALILNNARVAAEIAGELAKG